MKRRALLLGGIGAAAILTAKRPAAAAIPGGSAPAPEVPLYDIVIVGATPGGICAAVAAARMGSKALILERTAHIGGLPANGLGATDIATRGATGGLFLEFVERVKRHYVAKYGAESPQVKDCSEGYHFEPHVAETVFEEMLASEPNVTVLRHRQFDADPSMVTKTGERIVSIRVTHLESGGMENYGGSVFIDATYEGDLAAAAGCPFETRREGKAEYSEPFAGRIYRPWDIGPLGDGSTQEGDDTLQAYNYRLCLTDVPENRVAIEKPEGYDREEYASLIGDIARGHLAHFMPPAFLGLKGGADVGVVNPVRVPNGKTDTNNHHRAFVSTDLPEENWPYPREGWVWRDKFAARLRAYTLGLLWFCQHDDALPQAFRDEALKWGLSQDEYADSGHFPRQIYVREGRRITGKYLFTAKDCIAPAELPHAYEIMEGKRKADTHERPPCHRDSITASHYAIDSHAVRKREPNRVHLDGFLGLALITKPYQVPFGVMLSIAGPDNLLTPVPVSGTHLGFGTLRMEPCWMAMGHAAGVAAHLALTGKTPPAKVDVSTLQWNLLEQRAVLSHFRDVHPTHPQWIALQIAGCHGCFPELNARPDLPIDAATAADWTARAGAASAPAIEAGMTRGEFAAALFNKKNSDRT